MWSSDKDSTKIEVRVVHEVYQTRKEFITVDGKQQVIEKRKLVKELFPIKSIFKDAITSVDEAITLKNTISKTRAIIFDKYSQTFYLIDHSAASIRELLAHKPKTKIGF